MAKSEKAKFLEVEQGETAIKFVLGDGQSIVAKYEDFSEEIRLQAMRHGFNQKIRDAAASFSKESDYDGAFESMQQVVDALLEGKWKRQGGAGAGVVMEDLAYAIAKMKQVDQEKALAAVKKATDEQRKSWAKNAKVAQLMAESKAKRLAEAAKSASDEIEIDFGDEE